MDSGEKIYEPRWTSADAERCMKACAGGIRRFPQTITGGSLVLAHELLRGAPVDLGEFMRSEPTDELVGIMAKAMNDGHRIHHVPLATKEAFNEVVDPIKEAHGAERVERRARVISEDELRDLYFEFKCAALEKVAFFTGLQEGQIGYVHARNRKDRRVVAERAGAIREAENLTRYLRMPHTALRVRSAQNTFGTLIEVMRSKEGAQLAESIRNAASNTETGPIRDEEDKERRNERTQQLLDELIQLLRSKIS